MNSPVGTGMKFELWKGMKKTVLILLFMWLALPVIAQDKISGKITDKANGEPLEFVTVASIDLEGKIMDGTTSGSDGSFSISFRKGWTLKASLIGYFDVSLQEAQSPLTIEMEQNQEMLTGATVTERVKLVEMKLDKLIMNVSQSAFAQGSNAKELLKKAPGVTIDKDGNIKLNGKAVSVWIDGRPSYLDGKALETLLQGTDGGSIDKFEIMEHPSSKYDATGSGGIINIKTKRNMVAGLHGNVGLYANGMYYGGDFNRFIFGENMNANISYRGKKTNTFLNLYEGYTPFSVKADIFTTIPSESGIVKQDSRSILDMPINNWNVKLGNDWFIDDKNTVGFIISVPWNVQKKDSSPDKNHSERYLNDILISRDRTTLNSEDNRMNAGGNVNYTHVFAPERMAEMTVNLDYYRTWYDSKSHQEINTSLPAPLSDIISLRDIKSSNGVDIYSAKLDYQTLLWKKVMFEAGAKWALSCTSNDTRLVETGLEPLLQDNIFSYRESVGAAYFNMATQFGPKWSAKAGLRAEYTNSTGNWTSASKLIDRNYFNLFPTVYVGFTPNEKWRFSTSYSRRINRPNYFILNPTMTYVDAHSYTIGDPDILPEYSDAVNISIGKGQHLSLSLGYMHTGNWQMQIPVIKDNGDQEIRWGNFGHNNMAFLSFSVSALPVSKWLQWTLNVVVAYMKEQASIQSYSASTFFSNGYTCFSFLLPHDWKIDLDAYFSTPINAGFFKTRFSWTSNISIKKPLIENKLELTFGLDDIFRSSSNNIDILADASGKNSNSSLSQIYTTQSIKVGLNWNFGKAQKPLKHRNVGSLEEVSRSSGSSGISTGK